MSHLHQLGSTQQAVLRHLLRHPAGVDVESLCRFLRISHNAVRQHLTALMARQLVERAEPAPSGGRPQSRYRLSAAGHELFPRNYAFIAGALLEAVGNRIGREGAKDLLSELGTTLGRAEPTLAGDSDHDVAEGLAERLSRAGYEAVATKRGGAAQVEAFNCVFHSVARANSDVCRFDIAFMEAATGRKIQHSECIVRGGHVCRFIVGEHQQQEKNGGLTDAAAASAPCAGSVLAATRQNVIAVSPVVRSLSTCEITGPGSPSRRR